MPGATSEDGGGVVAREVDGLRVGVHRDAPVAAGLGDAAVGLHRRLLDGAGLVLVLDDVVGLGEALLHVAEADLRGAVILGVDVVIPGPVRGQRRRGARDRLLDVEHAGQRVVFHLHPGGAGAGGLGGFPQHGDDGLTPPAHLVEGEDRLVLRPDAHGGKPVPHLLARQILVGEHADDAGARLGRAGVHAHDPGVGLRAPVHLEVQHARVVDVLVVGRLAARVAFEVALADVPADDAEFLHRH